MDQPVKALASSVKQHPATLAELAQSAWRHRGLIVQLTKREVIGRYRGSTLGVLWSLVNPLLMLGVYTFVFSVVFGTRWPGAASTSKIHFAVVLFTGMIVFTIFAECVQRAPTLVVSQPNFVKKIVFPLEILPWVNLFSALFHACVSLAVLCIVVAITQGGIPWTALLAPFVLAPLIFLCLGASWFLAAMGVYLRDVGQIVGAAVTALMFLSPLFYPSSALPADLRWVAQLNPLAYPVEQARELIVFGRMPDVLPWIAYTVGSLLLMWGGFAWFQRTRKGFADVL